MNDNIQPATIDDLTFICQLFEEAIAYQRKNNYPGWSTYDRFFIEEDIRQGLLYKITAGSEIRCIFSVCYRDPLIWRTREKDDALYLHRIVINRAFGGQRLFQTVLDWAIHQARSIGRQQIRMDTWANNPKIIDYYQSYGFRFVENFVTADTPDLPSQHRNLHVALLELPLSPGPADGATGTPGEGLRSS